MRVTLLKSLWMVLLLPGLLFVSLMVSSAGELLPPCNHRVIVSGFGDLRRTHFHAGIDISTAGLEGIPVVAVDSGFVSRIKVRHNGYGKAIYLDTVSGLRALYAHLSGFSPRIDALVLAEQIARGSYEVELLLKPDLLVILPGDTLGWSGQSGAGPPHLHFEMRTLADIALNPLSLYPQLNNLSPPVAEALLAVPCTAASRLNGFPYPLELHHGDRFSCTGPVRFYLRATQSDISERFQLSVRRAELLCDDQLLFFRNDSLNFERNGWWRIQPQAVRGDWRLLNSSNLMCATIPRSECQVPVAGDCLQLVVENDRGLKDSLTCFVSQSVTDVSPVVDDEWRLYAGWLLAGAGVLNPLSLPDDCNILKLPAGCLQLIPNLAGVIQIQLDTLQTFLHLTQEVTSTTFTCGPWQLQAAAPQPEPVLLKLDWTEEELWLSPGNLALVEPLLLTVPAPGRGSWLYREQSGGWQPLACEYSTGADTLHHQIRFTGRIALLRDTMPPGVVFRHPSSADTLVRRDEIVSIQVTDALSGVSLFNCFVDEVPVFPEHDIDRDRLFFRHDARIAPGEHLLRVEVEDRVGNRRQRSISYRLLEDAVPTDSSASKIFPSPTVSWH